MVQQELLNLIPSYSASSQISRSNLVFTHWALSAKAFSCIWLSEWFFSFFFFSQSNLLCFLAGLGGACGYLIGAMDWGHSALGFALGSEYQVIYFFSSLTWGIFLTMHLFSIPEKPLIKDHSLDSCPTTSLLLEGPHHNGYGAVSKEPPPLPDMRQRSFSALSEANAVTPSAKHPNSEVSHLCYFESFSCGFYSWPQSAHNFPSHFNDLFQTLEQQPLWAVIRLDIAHASHRNNSSFSR